MSRDRAAADAALPGREATPSASGAGSKCCPASRAGRRSTAARRCPGTERIELDVWYVEHRSPRIDLKILLRTPLALFGGTYKGRRGGWRGGDGG